MPFGDGGKKQNLLMCEILILGFFHEGDEDQQVYSIQLLHVLQ